MYFVPEGRLRGEACNISRPSGTRCRWRTADPAINRWAIFGGPSGTRIRPCRYHEPLLKLVDLCSKLLDPCSLFPDLSVALSKSFFEFGHRHAGKLNRLAIFHKD